MKDFRDALLWHMNAYRTKVADLAAGSGVSLDIIKKLRTRAGASTNAEDATKIAAFYGKDVKEFINREEVPSDRAISHLIDLLEPQERQVLEAQIRAMIQVRGHQ